MISEDVEKDPLYEKSPERNSNRLSINQLLPGYATVMEPQNVSGL